MEKNHLQQLEGKLNEFKQVCTEFSDETDITELLKIIHRPGWTTVAELALVSGILDSLVAQTRNLLVQRKSLLAGSLQVEAGHAATV